MGYSAPGRTFGDVMGKLSDVEVDVWQSDYDVIDEDGIFKLLVYHPTVKRKYKSPLLIVYAFINRPYVLDLSPDISVIRKYLEAGFSVYMIDWGYPTKVDQYLCIGDYISYIDRCVEIIKEREEVEQVSLHGYCLGGNLSLIYTSLYKENVKNLMLQATPSRFDTDNTIAIWAQNLDADKMINAFKMAPGEFLNVGFLLVDPINLVMGKYRGLFETLEDDDSVKNFMRMEKWIFDSPAIAAETFRQYIKEWYQQNLIIKNEFQCNGKTVDLRNIDCPVLVLAATFDHIVPLHAQTAVLDAVSSKDKEVYETRKGHIGITVSSSAHKEFWPKVVKWLEERSVKMSSRKK